MDNPSAETELKAAWELIQAGKTANAEKLCTTLIEKNPEMHEAEFALGVARFRQGDKKGALLHLERYIDRVRDAVAPLGLAAQLLLETGQPERALELGRRAYELSPREGPVLLLHLSGKNFLAKNQPLSAIKAFKELIQLNPKLPAGYLGAAEAYQALGSTFDAAEMYERASALAPSKSNLLMLGLLELKIGRPKRALAVAETLLAKSPADPQGNALAAQSLVEQDRIAESESYWAVATKMDKGHSINLKRGASLAMMGHFDEGERYLRQSIEAEPRQGSAYQMIFANRKANVDDAELIAQMESLFGDPPISAIERAALAFALGKAWDDLGELGRGFAFYDQGHEIQREMLSTPYRPEQAEEQFRAQKQLFSAKAGISADDGPQPIFIVGMLRSGTTLTEQILSSHSQITGAGELDFWTASEGLMIDRAKPAFLEDVGIERRLAYRRILDSFGGGKQRVVDKFPGNLNLVGLIHHLFPGAHFLSLRRNPVDIAVSIWGIHSNPFSPFTVERHSVVSAIRHAIELADYWRSVLPADLCLEVRYEELATNPEAQIRNILAFCGLPWEDACLSASDSKKKVRTPSVWQVRQPVYTTSIERWKRYEPWLGEFASLLK